MPCSMQREVESQEVGLLARSYDAGKFQRGNHQKVKMTAKPRNHLHRTGDPTAIPKRTAALQVAACGLLVLRSG